MGARTLLVPTRAMILTGTYLGNGVDDRNIDIGIDLAAKNHPYVIITPNSGGRAMHRIEYGQGDSSMRYDNIGFLPNCIQAFTSTGFQIGDTAEVNSNGVTYAYIVFWQEP